MEITTRLLKLKNTLDQDINIFDVMGVGFIISIFVLFIILRVYTDCKEFTNPKSKNRIWMAFWIYGAISLAGFIFSIYEENKMYDERFTLEKEYAQSLDQESVIEIETLVTNKVASNKVCRMLDSGETKKCTLLEFVSNNDFHQIFISLTSEEQIQVSEGTKVTYLVLEEQDRHFLNQYLSLGDISINSDVTHFSELVKNKTKWSLGLSIHK